MLEDEEDDACDQAWQIHLGPFELTESYTWQCLGCGRFVAEEIVAAEIDTDGGLR